SSQLTRAAASLLVAVATTCQTGVSWQLCVSGMLWRHGFSKPARAEKVDARKTPASGLPQAGSEASEEDELREAEEKRIQTLMTNMAAMVSEEGRLTASAVGQIVGLQSEEIKQMASEYAERQWELSSEERWERFGPLQQQRRAVASLEKQIQQRREQLEELQARHAEMKSDCEEARGRLLEATEHAEQLDKQMKSFGAGGGADRRQ
ncbi:unnamed protein product, partial [Tetraodon nigroviridis]